MDTSARIDIGSQLQLSLKFGSVQLFPQGGSCQSKARVICPYGASLGYIAYRQILSYPTYVMELSLKIMFILAFVILHLFASFALATEELSSELPALNMIIEAGKPSLQLGNSKKLGSPDFILGWDFTYYPESQHGFGLNFLGEGIKGGHDRSLNEILKKGENSKIEAVYYGLHYSYRVALSRSVNMSYQPGAGWQAITEIEDRDSLKYKVSTWALSQRVNFDWNFSHCVLRDGRKLNFVLGAGIVHIYLPKAKVEGVSLYGNRVGGLLRVGFGI